MVITKQCIICNKIIHIEITEEQYKELKKPRSQRKSIQEILPDHTAGEREILISGICDECYNGMFK